MLPLATRAKAALRVCGHAERTTEAFSPWGALAAQLSHMSSKENLEVTEQQAGLPQSLSPALNPTKTLAAAARLFDHYTTALAKLADFHISGVTL